MTPEVKELKELMELAQVINGRLAELDQKLYSFNQKMSVLTEDFLRVESGENTENLGPGAGYLTEVIKNNLEKHHGAIDEVVQRSNYTREYVDMVLRGKSFNYFILNIAVDVTLERESKDVFINSIQEQLNASA